MTGAAPAAYTGQMFAIRADRAFDGTAFLDGVTLLVDGPTIAGVEPAGFRLPEGCPEIRHPGLLLPGLIDTHTHLVGDSLMGALDRVAGYSDSEIEAVVTQALADHLAAGITTVRDLGDRKFNVADRRRRAGEPTVLAAGPPLTTPGGHCFYLGGEVDCSTGPQAVDRAVAERVERGVDVIKVMASGGMLTPGTDVLAPQFSLEALRRIVDRAHAAGLPVTAHAHPIPAIRQAVQAGVDGIEHCTCLGPGGMEIDRRLFDEIAAAGVVVCGTAGTDPLNPFIPPPPIQAIFDRLGVTEDDMIRGRIEQLAALHAAGVRLVCGVDSGIGDTKPHGSVGFAVADHLIAGIPAEVALAGATSESADVCGLPAKGRLRAGADADLLAVDADPRIVPYALGTVAAVWLGGTQIAG